MDPPAPAEHEHVQVGDAVLLPICGEPERVRAGADAAEQDRLCPAELGFLVVNDIVWLVMGVGILFGGLPDVFAYFSPAGGNPFVLAWHATVVALWIAGIVWLFFRGGAQFVIDHPGILNLSPTHPLQVQLWYLACLAGGVIAEIMMWSGFLASNLPILDR